jgi:hypothetical protein
MACLPCQQQRQAFVGAARRYDPRGMVQAVSRAVAINVDKLKGVDVAQKYGGAQSSPTKASPYRRPDRSV